MRVTIVPYPTMSPFDKLPLPPFHILCYFHALVSLIWICDMILWFSLSKLSITLSQKSTFLTFLVVMLILGLACFKFALKSRHFPLWKASLCPENNGKDVRMDYKVHWTRNNKEEIKFRLLSPKLYGQHKKRTLQDVKVHLDSPIYDFLCQNTATEEHRHSQSSPPLPHQDIEGRFKMPTA